MDPASNAEAKSKSRVVPSGTMGRKRRRHYKGGGPRLSVDKELLRRTSGFTFPTVAATPKQEKALHELAIRYHRQKLCKQAAGLWPDSTFEGVFRVSPTMASKILDDADQVDSPEQGLAEAVLSGMLSDPPTIAGIHGNRRTKENRAIFYAVNEWLGNLTRDHRQDHARFGNAFICEYRDWVNGEEVDDE